MATYTYTARSREGQQVSGRIEATTEREAVTKLRALGHMPTAVRHEQKPQVNSVWKWLTRTYLAPFIYPASTKAKAAFFRSFAVLLGTGMGMQELGEALAESTTNRTLRRVSLEIGDAGRRGETISSVMQEYPGVFQRHIISLIKTGETGGSLEQTLRQIADFLDIAYEIELEFKMQTFYPKVLAVVILGLPLAVVTAFPPAAQFLTPLMSLSTIWAIVGIFFAAYMIWKALMTWEPWKRGIDRIKLLLPWVGGVIRRSATARWARAMALLYAAGVPLRTAMEACSEAVGNSAMAADLLHVAPLADKGIPFHEVLRASHALPPAALRMAMTGERTGSMDVLLSKIAEFYEGETKVAARQSTILIFVLLLLFAAAVVGYMVISFYSGYYDKLFQMVPS